MKKAKFILSLLPILLVSCTPTTRSDSTYWFNEITKSSYYKNPTTGFLGSIKGGTYIGSSWRFTSKRDQDISFLFTALDSNNKSIDESFYNIYIKTSFDDKWHTYEIDDSVNHSYVFEEFNLRKKETVELFIYVKDELLGFMNDSIKEIHLDEVCVTQFDTTYVITNWKPNYSTKVNANALLTN